MYTVSQFTGPYFAKRAAVRILKNHDKNTIMIAYPFFFPGIVNLQERNSHGTLNVQNFVPKIQITDESLTNTKAVQLFYVYIINFQVSAIAHALPNGHSNQGKKRMLPDDKKRYKRK